MVSIAILHAELIKHYHSAHWYGIIFKSDMLRGLGFGPWSALSPFPDNSFLFFRLKMANSIVRR